MGLEIAAIAAIAGGGLNILEQQQQASQEQDFLKQQESLAREQAAEEVERSERTAEAEEIQATETARRSRLRDKELLEQERAFMAESGVSLTHGTPLKIEEENQITSALNASDIFREGLARGSEIRFEGKQAERALLFEADQHKFQRKLSKSTAKRKLIGGIVNTGFSAFGAQKGTTASSFSKGSRGIGASSGVGPNLNKSIGFGSIGF